MLAVHPKKTCMGSVLRCCYWCGVMTPRLRTRSANTLLGQPKFQQHSGMLDTLWPVMTFFTMSLMNVIWNFFHQEGFRPWALLKFVLYDIHGIYDIENMCQFSYIHVNVVRPSDCQVCSTSGSANSPPWLDDLCSRLFIMDKNFSRNIVS